MAKQSILFGQHVARFSLCHREASKIWLTKSGLPDAPGQIRGDSFLAMCLFAGMAHERQGTNPNFSRFHRVALRRALRGGDFEKVLMNDSDFPNRVWHEFEKLTQGKPNKRQTEGPIKDILVALREADEPNVLHLIATRSLGEARSFLKGIRGIGDKVSALVMRDFHYFFELWQEELKASKEKYFHLQPVDRWVRRVSEIGWKTTLGGNHDAIAVQIVALCQKENVDPVEFNQGAWFIGAKLRELCAFYKIPEEAQEISTQLIDKFNPEEIAAAVKRTYFEFQRREVFLNP